MSESHDTYADEFRGDFPMAPDPPKNVKENVDEAFFTGVGEGVEPPEIGEFPVGPLPDKPTGGKHQRSARVTRRLEIGGPASKGKNYQ